MGANRDTSPETFNRLPFREKLDVLYGVSARDRRDLILSAPDAQRLVRSFAAESLFYTIKDLGLEDSIELVALASGEQISALVDLDCWKKDRFENQAMVDWLEILSEGGAKPLGELLNSIDLELLILFLKRFVHVVRTDDPEEPPEVEGAEVFELDEHYQIVFPHWTPRCVLVRQLIEALHEQDYSYFVTVMEEVWWGVESELEERSFLLRNARLQDRGFPDYYEALDVLRPVRETELPRRTAPLRSARADADDASPIAADHTVLFAEDARSFLAEILNAGFRGEVAAELRLEMAYLTNRVLVAEGVDFSDREQVAAAVRLTHDTVNLALERLAGADLDRGVAVVGQHHLQHLFQLGWGLLIGLRRRAKETVGRLGLSPEKGEIGFLDTPHREALSGLLRPRPRYFEGIDRPGETRFRTFGSLADVERASAIVADVAALPDLCERLVAQRLGEVAALRPRDADDFRVSAVLLTGFAHRVLDRPPSLQPLEPEDLAELRRRTLDPEAGRLSAAVRRRFLEDAGAGRSVFEFALRRFEEEFLAIAPDRPLDPRFVTCLMIATVPRGARAGAPTSARHGT